MGLACSRRAASNTDLEDWEVVAEIREVVPEPRELRTWEQQVRRAVHKIRVILLIRRVYARLRVWLGDNKKLKGQTKHSLLSSVYVRLPHWLHRKRSRDLTSHLERDSGTLVFKR